MELLKLKIESPFRNLEGLEITFKETINTYVLIGNNGSGKSSVLEAISSIFSVLYYGTEDAFEFGFTLAYRIEGRKVNLHFSKESVHFTAKVDNVVVDWTSLKMNHLPSRVISNYSGEDTRMADLYYQTAYDKYIEDMKNSEGASSLNMVLIDKSYWQVIFLVMLACQNQVDSFRNFMQETVGLNAIRKILLEADEAALATWQDNTITYYFRQLLARRNPDHQLQLDQVNVDDALTPLNLFLNLVSVNSVITNLQIEYNHGVNASLLSEGEKKLMVVLFILEAVADEKSIVLLDEPDSHIHVARKGELLKYLQQTINRENLLTSHSPSLTALFDLNSVKMLDKQPDGKVSVVPMSKQEIVSQLTKDRWSLQDQQLFLASNNDIILIEGITDEVYLSKALQKFQRDGQFLNLKFSYLPCNGSANIKLLKGRFEPKPGQMMFALFDNDDAGWQGISSLWNRDKDHKFTQSEFNRARKLDGMWIAPYPAPKKKVGIFNVEDYFPRRVFLKFIMSFKKLNDVVGKDAFKKLLSEACKKSEIGGKDYDKFGVVFQLIEDIKTADAAGLDILI